MDSQTLSTEAVEAALSVQTECGNPTLQVTGELDVATAGALVKHLEDAVRDASGPVVLDLENLTFIDASGLNTVLRAQHAADRSGVRLMLRNCPHCFHRIVDLTGLDAVFDIEPTVDTGRC